MRNNRDAYIYIRNKESEYICPQNCCTLNLRKGHHFQHIIQRFSKFKANEILNVFAMYRDSSNPKKQMDSKMFINFKIQNIRRFFSPFFHYIPYSCSNSYKWHTFPQTGNITSLDRSVRWLVYCYVIFSCAKLNLVEFCLILLFLLSTAISFIEFLGLVVALCCRRGQTTSSSSSTTLYASSFIFIFLST